MRAGIAINHYECGTHCTKSVQIRSYFWFVFSRIRTEYGEILRTIKMQYQKYQKIQFGILLYIDIWEIMLYLKLIHIDLKL